MTESSEVGLIGGASLRFRDEAHPRLREDLTAGQRAVYDDVMAWVAHRANEPAVTHGPLASDHRPRYLPRVRPDQKRNVLLIEGARGSGKTTVLETALAEFVRWHLPSLRQPSEGSTAAIAFPGPSQNVVPLELVHLENLPRERSVVFQLVSQLGRVVDGLDTDEPDPPYPAPLARHEPFASRESEPRRKWNELVQAVALAWTSGGTARRTQVSPKAFVSEFEETERRVGDAQLRFIAFVDALATEFCARKLTTIRPLFLVPIDDADMQPERTLELVEMLRAFKHPNALFLLTGNLELLTAALQNECFGMLRGPLRGSGGAGLSPHADRRHAIDLAHQVLEKVIPVPQRLGIGGIGPADRVHLAQLDALTTSPPTSPPLGAELLGRALPDRIRSLLDLRGDRATHAVAEIHEELLDPAPTVYRLWKAAVEEDGRRLPTDIAEQLSQAVDFARSSNRFYLTRGMATIERTGFDTFRSARDPRLHINLRHQVGFDAAARRLVRGDEPFVAPSDELTTETTQAVWPERLTAAGVLVWVLAARDDLRVQLTIARLERVLHLVVHDEGRLEGGRSVLVRWPRPAYRDLGLHLQLIQRWDDQELLLRKATPAQLAWLFLRTVLDVGLGNARNPKEGHSSRPDFSTLGRDLSRLTGSKMESRAHAEWLDVGLPLLAAPESGLPAEVADVVFRLWKEHRPERNRRTQAVLEARRRRLSQSEVVSGAPERWDEALRVLDVNSLTFAFAREVGDVGTTLVGYLEELTQRWRTEDPAGRWRGGFAAALTNYLTSGRKMELTGDARWLHDAVEMVRSRPLVAGATARLVADWWSLFRTADARTVRFEDGQLVLEPGGFKDSWEVARSLSELSLDDDLTASFQKLSSRFSVSSDRLEPAQRVVYDIACDIRSDADALLPLLDSNRPTVDVPFNKSLVMRVRGQEFFPPMPLLLAPFDNEWIFAKSSSAIDALAGLRGPRRPDRADAHEFVDAYYVWFIGAVYASQFDERKFEQAIRLRVPPEEVRGVVQRSYLGTQALGQNKPERRPQWGVWVRDLPLFATPELGASNELASMILSVALGDDGKRHDVTADALRQHRKAYWQRLGRNAKLMARIDKLRPDHPWVQRVVNDTDRPPTMTGRRRPRA
jgi:hypothetical protein